MGNSQKSKKPTSSENPSPRENPPPQEEAAFQEPQPPRQPENMASRSQIQEAYSHLCSLLQEFKMKLEPKKESCQRDNLFYFFLQDLSKFVKLSRYLKLLEEEQKGLYKLISGRATLKKFQSKFKESKDPTHFLLLLQYLKKMGEDLRPYELSSNIISSTDALCNSLTRLTGVLPPLPDQFDRDHQDYQFWRMRMMFARLSGNSIFSHKVHGQHRRDVQLVLHFISALLNTLPIKPDSETQSTFTQLKQIFSNSCILQTLISAFAVTSVHEVIVDFENYFRFLDIVFAFLRRDTFAEVLLRTPSNVYPPYTNTFPAQFKEFSELLEIYAQNMEHSKQTKMKEGKILVTKVQNVLRNIKKKMTVLNIGFDLPSSSQVQNQEQKTQKITNLQNCENPRQAYSALFKKFRFGFTNVLTDKGLKFLFQNDAKNASTSSETKLSRLSQEMTDLAMNLPIHSCSAIIVRTDNSRVDVMRAIIFGAQGTPYAHGAFLYDLFFQNSYPLKPPKCYLRTGNNKVRFNPNLYNNGYVCLSLLGTWRGGANENWEPQRSTLLQILISIQAIVMGNDVYYNEPGFESSAGTKSGQAFNQGYSNIVRLCNVKYAMIEQIQKPPTGFEQAVRAHFYLKRKIIIEDIKGWLEAANVKEANYGGMVSGQNNNWCSEFNHSQQGFRTKLKEALTQLETEFKKLSPPKIQSGLTLNLSNSELNEQKKKEKIKRIDPHVGALIKPPIQKILHNFMDMSYDSSDSYQDFMGFINEQEIKIQDNGIRGTDVTEEQLKDRWSRQVGGMGLDAVKKQSAAVIAILRVDSLGAQIAKNIALAGCRKIILVDDIVVTQSDKKSNFLLMDGNGTRAESAKYALESLNPYTTIETYKTVQEVELTSVDVLVVTDIFKHPQPSLQALNQKCRESGVKFIISSTLGVCSLLFNDFGDKFEVTDVDGEQPQQFYIKNIVTQDAHTFRVELLAGSKHEFQDKDLIQFSEIQGFSGGPLELKIKEIINTSSFLVQAITASYSAYGMNGKVKKIKMKKVLSFKTYLQACKLDYSESLDQNLSVYDFSKIDTTQELSIILKGILSYESQNKEKDNSLFSLPIIEASQRLLDIIPNNEESKIDTAFIQKVLHSGMGQFWPLTAALGGLVAQEVSKGVTHKYSPVQGFFYLSYPELLPDVVEKNDFALSDDLISETSKKLRKAIGQGRAQILRQAKIFQVGAGAIGCQLLKNLAYLDAGSSSGQVMVTDPDNIELSNLSRQFLFREKDLRQAKAITAGKAVLKMNNEMKLFARVDKVHSQTQYIFHNEFWSSRDIVLNALDNVAARKYVDTRCIRCGTALLDSGTLGPKGHVQTIYPNVTETYGAQGDPENQVDIPLCTLKLFPEEPLHCLEWGRDKFVRIFTQKAEIINQVLTGASKEPSALVKAYKTLKNRPKNLIDCFVKARLKFQKYFHNDSIQIQKTYPESLMLKDGTPFWKLPKRRPSPLIFDIENALHFSFVFEIGLQYAKMFAVEEFESPQEEKNLRADQQKQQKVIRQSLKKLKIPEFVPKGNLKQELGEEEEEEEKKQEQNHINKNEVEVAMKELEILKKGENFKLLSPQQFQKDQDNNGQVASIAAFTNCRATAYGLEHMSWIDVKLKAGRIVPAFASTTAIVAGLQTIQMVKMLILRAEQAESERVMQNCRNSFVNLALPLISMSEPGSQAKRQITSQFQTTQWSLLQVEKGSQLTLGQLINQLEQKTGLKVWDIFMEEECLLLQMSLLSKSKEEQAETLKQPLVDLLGLSQAAKFDELDGQVDLRVTFAKKDRGDQKPEFVEKMPPVILKLN